MILKVSEKFEILSGKKNSMSSGTTSPSNDGDMVKVGTKTPEPTPLTRPTKFSKKNRKARVPDDPDPEPSLSVSPSKKMKRDKKKNCRKHKKDDSSDPSSSDDSDSYFGSDYRHK